MSKQGIILYVLSFLLFPITALVLLLGFWIVFPKHNKEKQTKVRIDNILK